MKKSFSLILALLMCLSLCACISAHDATPPAITMTRSSFEVECGYTFRITDFADNININDNKDGKIDVSMLMTDDTIDTSVIGAHPVRFYVRDAAGNIATADITVVVTRNGMTYDSYSEKEKEMYLSLSEGEKALKRIVGNYEFQCNGRKYDSKLEISFYSFSVTNKYGEKNEAYGAYFLSDEKEDNGRYIADIDSDYKDFYQNADRVITMEELETFLEIYEQSVQGQ